MHKLSDKIQENNGEIISSNKIEKAVNLNNSVILSGNNKEWEFDLVFNCVGLHSDRNYKTFTGKRRPLRIVPFRGEFLMLK